MNLRWFHALLIILSAALAALFAALTAFAVSFGLVVYDSWFLRKTRTLR